MTQTLLRPVFALDADVFIAAYQRYYQMELCPGFWDSLVHFSRSGRVLSIDRIYDDLEAKDDDLFDWAKGAPLEMFVSSSGTDVVATFSSMMTWAQSNPKFTQAAKSEFAQVSDGWLAAYAKVHNATLVTQEVYDPNIRRRVKLPNVCREFGIPTLDTFEMLRQLGIRFDWSPPS